MIPEYLKNLGIKEEIDMPRIFSNLEHAHPDDRKFFLEYIEKPVMREWSRYSYYDRWRISLGEAIFNSASF